jgi:hypothetical protein
MLAIAVLSLSASHADGQITFSGLPSITGPTTSGAGTFSPAALVGTPTSDGFKVTGVDLVYNTLGGELGKIVDFTWSGRESLTVGPKPASITFTDHLDGSATYNSSSFSLNDVSLRTITASTDFDLTTLHTGPIAAGGSFNLSLSSGPFTLSPGNDVMLQFFDWNFTINTNSPDTITLHLPDSVQSSISPIPEPSSIVLFLSSFLILIGFATARRLARRHALSSVSLQWQG